MPTLSWGKNKENDAKKSFQKPKFASSLSKSIKDDQEDDLDLYSSCKDDISYNSECIVLKEDFYSPYTTTPSSGVIPTNLFSFDQTSPSLVPPIPLSESSFTNLHQTPTSLDKEEDLNDTGLDFIEIMTDDGDDIASVLNSSSSSIASLRSISSTKSVPLSSPVKTDSIKTKTELVKSANRNLAKKPPKTTISDLPKKPVVSPNASQKTSTTTQSKPITKRAIPLQQSTKEKAPLEPPRDEVKRPQSGHPYLKRKSISFVIPARNTPRPSSAVPPARLTSPKSPRQQPTDQLEAKESKTPPKKKPADSFISSFIAEYDGRRKKVEFISTTSSISTLRAIERKIKEKFQIERKEKIRLMFYDGEYKQWLEVDTIKDLASAKVKVEIYRANVEENKANKTSASNSSGESGPLSPYRDFENSKGWVVMKTLGIGSFGRVLMCFDSNSNEMIAVKKLLCTSESERQKIEKETTILRNVQHPNIVIYKGVDFSNDFCYLIMEFCGGSLAQVLKRMSKGFPESIIQLYLKQILMALTYLHEERDVPVFHRDIKCENILLKNAETVKLGDFGEAKVVDSLKKHDSPTKTKAITGTILYICIEQLKGDTNFKRSRAPDIWSLGMTILEMVLGKNIWLLLFPNNLSMDHQYVEFMINNIDLVYSNIPQTTSPELRDLILKCLSM